MSNPYLNAREEWLERYGSYIQSRNQWRVTAYICLGVTVLAVAGLVLLSFQNKVVPYVVEVDKLGNTRAVQRADVMGTVPTRVIQADLARFIVNWRSVTADLGLQRRRVGQLAAFASGSTKGVLREWLTVNNPYDRAKNVLVEVDVKSLPQPVSDSSWRVEWTETVRNHAGVALSRSQNAATLTVSIHPPKTDQQILNNPAGIYVSGLTYGKLFQNEESSK